MQLRYICPVCGRTMDISGHSYVCPARHSFDIARKGYVNLLTTSGRNPAKAGDDPDMVKARTAFLDSGHYERLARTVGGMAGDHAPCGSVIDSGCGEGYYTAIYAAMQPDAFFHGIDISKTAVNHCMTRIHAAGLNNAAFAAASSYALPFESSSADMVISTFAPVVNDEYARVLKKDGVLVVVSPSPRHLFELKAAVYDEPYENKANSYGLDSFAEEDRRILEYQTTLVSAQQIHDLFLMTPYFYKTSAEGMERLSRLDSLDVTCGFVIQVFRKKGE